ncbi:MAG: VanZ family protein [Clostridium sp.]
MCCISTILYMSSKPGEESSKTSLAVVNVISETFHLNPVQKDVVHFMVRKAAHFTEYFILSFLVTATYSEFFNRKLNVSFILLVCVLVAISDEFLQSFIEGRGSQVRDVIIDFSGSSLQLLMYLMLGLAFKQKKGLYVERRY